MSYMAFIASFIIYAISQLYCQILNRKIFFLTITPNIVLSFVDPQDPSIQLSLPPLSSPSESIVHHFAFFSSSSKRIVRRKEGFLREEGDGQCNRERLANGTVTNVFRWHSCYDLSMNICYERKYLCTLYCTRDETRPVLMQNPFENRRGEKRHRTALHRIAPS